MTVEVSMDTSLNEAFKSKTLDARRVRKAKPRTKTKTKAKAKTRAKPKKTKSKAKKTKKAKPKKTKLKTKSKTKPKKTKTKATPKSTKAKAKKTKSNACPIENKKTPGKKGPKHGLRSLISILFPRAGSQQSSSDECEAFDEEMHTPSGWGETYFGFTEEIYGTMTPKKLLSLAKKAWGQAHSRKPESILLVAALYVPGHGVYFGTIPHNGGEDKFKQECASFTALWDDLLERRELASGSGSQQLYHAEDAAMLYAFKKGAFGDGSKFPPGSMMVTLGGAKARGTPPQRVAACSKGRSNISPDCHRTLAFMGIEDA